MLQNVNKELLTDVKELHNTLTTPTQTPLTSHTTPTQLSLARFQNKFVPLPTLKRVISAHSSYFLIYCLTNIFNHYG